MKNEINIPKLLTALTIGSISSQVAAGEKIEIKKDLISDEVAEYAKDFVNSDKESKEGIINNLFEISDNIKVEGEFVVKNIDALKAYTADSTNTSTSNSNTRWNTYGATNCYSNCYTNCYRNCHGSRGWR